MTEHNAELGEQAQTWWSKALLIGAVVALVLLPLAALGYRVHLWSVGGAFLVFGGAAVLAVLGLCGGIIGLIVAFRKALNADKPALYGGTLIVALILGYMALQFDTAVSVPPIHDISTDVSDPPRFDKIVAIRGQANSLDYDGAVLGPQQATAYPWVKTLQTSTSVAASYRRALGVLQDMGLEIVNEDPDHGLIEAIATSFWFGFKDDLVVRLRATAIGSTVDVRSVSRVGQSDLGENAKRIGAFLQAMQS